MVKQNPKSQLQPQSVTASKKEYETLWMNLFFFIIVVFTFLAHKVYLFQNLELQESGTRLGNFPQLLFYGIPFGLIFALIDYVFHYFCDDLCEKYFIDRQKYPQEKYRLKRCFTLVKWFYTIFYYIITSTFAILFLKDTHIWPQFLGGHGSCSRMYDGFPDKVQANQYMKIFYICQFGKHFTRAFLHLFVRSQGNYYEYALHHMLSTFLITFSYLMNFWYVGVMILLTHDFSDIFLSLSRAYRDFRNRRKWVTSIFDVLTFVSWFGCRLIMFPICCISPSINDFLTRFPAIKPMEMSQKMFALLDIFYFPSGFLVVMLLILQFLQIFWTYYIFRSIVAISVAPKFTTHNYD